MSAADTAQQKAENAKNVTVDKAHEAKGLGEQKAGEAQKATQGMAQAVKDKAHGGGEGQGVWEQTKSKASDATVAVQENASGTAAYVRDTAIAAKDQAAGALGQAHQTVKDTFSKSH